METPTPEQISEAIQITLDALSPGSPVSADSHSAFTRSGAVGGEDVSIRHRGGDGAQVLVRKGLATVTVWGHFPSYIINQCSKPGIGACGSVLIWRPGFPERRQADCPFPLG